MDWRGGTQQETDMNPFYNIAEFLDFPAMTPAAAEEALSKLLADAKTAVDASVDARPGNRLARHCAPLE